MRRLIVWVPQGGADTVRALATDNGATQAVGFAGQGADGPVDVMMLHAPNRSVDALVGALGALPELRLSMLPHGVLALEPPAQRAPEQVVDVTLRSPLEVLLSGLQSIGSWTGFLAYAVAGGIVVFVGLATDTIFLLTASMLIAPFAGPAMNTALATARGDTELLRRSLLRYVVGLAVAGLAAAAAAVAFGLAGVTATMADTASISVTAVLLPLAAGGAGAMNLAQSERSSLVSGAATGMLVAASLAPPVGVVGMAGVLGEWTMVRDAGFLLALQLVGINLAGAVVFRLVGLRPQGVRYPRGRPVVARVAAASSMVGLVALLTWQIADPPGLQRATYAQQATSVVQDVVRDDAGTLLDVSADFSLEQATDTPTLYVTAAVRPEAGGDSAAAHARVSARLRRELQRRLPGVEPLVDLTVVDGD